ncbi:MAG: hypothetical protein IT564_00650 [Rhodospirillales bacterium]|nr:hypothetical protein [Rhodospirillales bacterium]
MALIALAAHDPGGASVLVAAAPALRDRGHGLLWLPSGPAARLWREAGEYVPKPMDGPAAAAAVAREQPGLLLTGASFLDDFERKLWFDARRLRIPSFAVLDSWSNLELRFTPVKGSHEQPDVLGVIDERTRKQITDEGWCRARLFVVGQPHLAARTERLKRRRRVRPSGGGKRVMFFSEPIGEDYGRAARGFTQFEVATLAAEALAGSPGVVMDVKPHPREAESGWRDWLVRTPNARLAVEDTETLLAAADGVLGMTTIVLIEAALVGIPALSLQPERPKILNPVLEEMVPVVARREEAMTAVRAWLSGLGRPAEPLPRGAELLDGAARLVAAVEETLRGPA